RFGAEVRRQPGPKSQTQTARKHRHHDNKKKPAPIFPTIPLGTRQTNRRIDLYSLLYPTLPHTVLRNVHPCGFSTQKLITGFIRKHRKTQPYGMPNRACAV
ncbi:hypothetical protein MM716_29435, partial [Klebsiella pneumoniae]|nr:hypothetical protein [Klebsiella pneumoniae]